MHMATLLKRQTTISSRGPRPRTRCVVLKATSVLPAKQLSKASPAVISALSQRTGSYVNFSATAVDFFRVLARLEAASSLPPEALSGTAPPTPGLFTPQLKPLAGVFGRWPFGGARSSRQSQTDSDDMSDSEDESPLRHAVVMFTATWCGPCTMVYRELKQAANRLQGRPPTAIIVVDVETERELASELGIKALPTLLYLSPNSTRGPIFTQGPVSATFILDTLDRAMEFGGRDLRTKWRKL